ncbi:hypothetical protein [Nostocoides vanveenii]|uniref:Uncharacterized protein n=1 Tax=Nostocoides vanveenii TaxID=330835 RepID=A0ABN2KML4_9MICO
MERAVIGIVLAAGLLAVSRRLQVISGPALGLQPVAVVAIVGFGATLMAPAVAKRIR